MESASLSVRAAWLHYAGGYTQADVARRLGVSNLKAHRLITRANKDGLVKVYIDGDVAECTHLEDQLARRFELGYCEVVPDLHEEGLPLRALGVAGAQYLKRLLENPDLPAIGIGHGRTLAACVDGLSSTPVPEKTIVSLLGGFSRSFSANPYDVIHRLAEKTQASAYVMPVPFFVNSQEIKEVFLEQSGITEVLQLAGNASVNFIGIGTVDHNSSIVSSYMLESSEMDEIQDQGGVGEILGHFFDQTGKRVETDLSDRTMGLNLDDLRHSTITAVAGGRQKTRAISAILNSRLLSGLIIDEQTARALIDTPGISDDHAGQSVK